jgi:predicted permease
MVIRNSFGMYIGTQFNNNAQSDVKKPFEFKKLVIDMCKFPPLLAVIAGFILHGLVGPENIDAVPGLDIFKTIALYGSLLLVGVSFQDLSDLHPSKLFSRSTSHVSGIRFILAPILAFIPIFLFKFEPIIAIPILIQSMAPPAVSNIIYGTFFKLNESLTSTLITIVTLLALVILPFELILFFNLFSV